MRVERAADEVPPMLLASSHPHDDVAVNVRGVRIPVCPMDSPCRLGVLMRSGMLSLVKDSAGSSGFQSISSVALPLWARTHDLSSPHGWF